MSQRTCHWWQDSTLFYDLSTLGLSDTFLCVSAYIHNQWKSVRWNLKSEKSEKQDCKIWGGGTQILYNCPKPHAPRGCTTAGSQSHHFLPPEHREQQQPSTNSAEIVHELNVIFATTVATTTTSTRSNTTQQQQQQQQLQKQQRTTKDKLHMLMTGSNRITLKNKITNTNKKHWYLDILPSSNRSHIKFQLIIFPPHPLTSFGTHRLLSDPPTTRVATAPAVAKVEAKAVSLVKCIPGWLPHRPPHPTSLNVRLVFFVEVG